MSVGIYKITSPSGRAYIGQSWNIKKRFYKYRSGSAIQQPYLNNSLKKYGARSHKYEIVCELPADITQEQLDNYERTYISQYKDCGFEMMNCMSGGKGRGKHSQETKEKIGALSKGRKHSERTKKMLSELTKSQIFTEDRNRKIGDSKRGIPRSEETKKKLSLSLKGKKHGPRSEETKRKISESNKGKPKSEEHKTALRKAKRRRKYD